ncbi:MAG: ABC transporter ATP-binding protein [Desulfobacteraceae bacterium]|nr:ABC transporter ATP-binding protein [Desulfobacteraceae bacterium]
MTQAVSVKNLSHCFGDCKVLDNLSFETSEKSFFIIIGPNGSGKTTLLKLLAGLIPSPKSSICLLSRNIENYRPKQLARQLAYVPQKAPEQFAFSVTEVVLMGRAPHLGLLGFEDEADRQLAREAMAFTHVEHLAHRRVDQLSGGEQQRVFIARAICQQPRIIVLDEPTSALDLSHQVSIMDLMEKLKTQRQMTVVMVSHDLNLAAMFADNLLLMNQGKIAAFGQPEKVLDQDLLEKVYGCKLLVDESPLGNYPRVNLVPGRHLASG